MGPRRYVRKSLAAWEGWTRSSKDGVLCGTSGRGGDVVAEERKKETQNKGLWKAGSIRKFYILE